MILHRLLSLRQLDVVVLVLHSLLLVTVSARRVHHQLVLVIRRCLCPVICPRQVGPRGRGRRNQRSICNRSCFTVAVDLLLIIHLHLLVRARRSDPRGRSVRSRRRRGR